MAAILLNRGHRHSHSIFLSKQPCSLLTVHRPMFPSAGAIEKDAHAEGFGPFGGDQPALAADVVFVLKSPDLRFVPYGIALQPGDAFLQGSAEAGTDFEAFFEAGLRMG